MLGQIRKFSSSIYAKILMGIIIIPFVFWGMGSNFVGGNKNVIVVIDKEKHSVQSFFDFIQKFAPAGQEIESNEIDNLLSAFIGEKLMEKEVEYFGIKLSDNSLKKLIKIQKGFQRNDSFSRVEYEKFLLKNNITAASFEADLAKVEKRKQLLDLIGEGIYPTKYLVNISFNRINQKRDIEIINLNDLFKRKINFTDSEIKTYFENNKNKYKEIFKFIKLIELTPNKLIASEEFNDTFFKKIDEIDYMIIEGKKLDSITEKFNLEDVKTISLNESGLDMNLKPIAGISEKLTKNIFSLNDIDSISLIEFEDKYFAVEIVKTEEMQKEVSDTIVRKDIILNLGEKEKRKIMSEIISKINNNNFTKSDFEKLSNQENVAIKKITLKNIDDNKLLKKELVKDIYSFPEKKIMLLSDLRSENYLVYIDKIKNVNIKENSDDFQKYLNISKNAITNDLYNTYDNYIKKRYKIDVNYKTLDAVKNRLN